MEITTENFTSCLPTIISAIRASLFIAIDTELTGLHSASWLRPLPIDTVDSRWARIRDSASKFSVLQFGLCCFTWDESRKSFVARPFAFYLHPRKSSVGLDRDGGGEAVLTVGAEALTFLSAHKFDFNKAIAKGIPWLSREAERAIRTERSAEASHRLRVTRDSESNVLPRVFVIPVGSSGAGIQPQQQDIVLRAPADVEWYTALTEKLASWVARARAWDADARASPVTHGLEFEDDAHGNAFPFLVLEPMNGFRRLVCRVVISNALCGYNADAASGAGRSDSLSTAAEGMLSTPSPVLVWTRRGDQVGPDVSDFAKRLRVVWVGSRAAAYAALQSRRAEAEVSALVDEAVGFRAVMDAVAASGVPVVGHNCQLDFAHSTAKFIGPTAGLPADVAAWAAALATLFPGGVWDTKAMIAGPGPLAQIFANRTSLSEAYSVVQSRDGGMWFPPVAPSIDASDTAVTSGTSSVGTGDGGRRTKRKWGSDSNVEGISVNFPSLARVILHSSDTSGDDADAVLLEQTVNSATATASNGTRTAMAVADVAPLQIDEALGFEDFAHDAGADAAMTGIVFLRCAALLASSIVATPRVEEAVPAGSAADSATAVLVNAATPTAIQRATLKLQPVDPAQLVDILQSLRCNCSWIAGSTSAVEASTAGSPQPLSFKDALRSFRGQLYQMRIIAPEHKLLNVEHAAAIAEGKCAPGNSLLVARTAADQSRLLHVEGLTHCVDSDALVARIAAAAGIAPHLIDRRRHVYWVDDRSAFVVLPSRMHVFAAATAFADEGRKMRAALASMDLEDDVPAFADVRTGENMFGLGAFEYSEAEASTIRATAAAAAAAERDALSAEPVYDGLRGTQANPILIALPYSSFLSVHRDVFAGNYDHELLPNKLAAVPAVASAVDTSAGSVESTLPEQSTNPVSSPKRPSCCVM